MNLSRKPLLLPVMAGVIAASATGLAQAGNEKARVVSSTPIYETVSVPREVCRAEQVVVPGRSSGAGAIMGGIAGGAMGNAIGGGSGRAIATVLGVVGGAVLGDRIEGRGPATTQTVQRCQTEYVSEQRPAGYNVVYEYAGRRYSMQTEQAPGRYVNVNVTPSAPAYRPQAGWQPPQPGVIHIDAQPQPRGPGRHWY